MHNRIARLLEGLVVAGFVLGLLLLSWTCAALLNAAVPPAQAASDSADPPSCAGWAGPSSFLPPSALTLSPVVHRHSPTTRVEVWIHTVPGYPRSESGWAELLHAVPPSVLTGDSDILMLVVNLPSGGDHYLTMQVYDNGDLVDGWRTNPRDCLVRVGTPGVG